MASWSEAMVLKHPSAFSKKCAKPNQEGRALSNLGWGSKVIDHHPLLSLSLPLNHSLRPPPNQLSNTKSVQNEHARLTKLSMQSL